MRFEDIFGRSVLFVNCCAEEFSRTSAVVNGKNVKAF